MSMQADVEKLMAQLFTDRASRERFVADPASAAKEAGLSAEETEAVLRIDVRDLLTAARSYDNKRRSQRRSEFPLRDWWRAWRR
jgi:hypothetical protein